ncbi:MAG: zinc-ribbon domain-containing protein [archaeon]|nr:lysine biosynthesis protein LysW [Candidatus Micrarchaeota archaeon]
MKVVCPRCGEDFEVDSELYEEGDSVECPGCGIELSVVRKGKKLCVVDSLEEVPEEDYEE